MLRFLEVWVGCAFPLFGDSTGDLPPLCSLIIQHSRGRSSRSAILFQIKEGSTFPRAFKLSDCVWPCSPTPSCPPYSKTWCLASLFVWLRTSWLFSLSKYWNKLFRYFRCMQSFFTSCPVKRACMFCYGTRQQIRGSSIFPSRPKLPWWNRDRHSTPLTPSLLQSLQLKSSSLVAPW